MYHCLYKFAVYAHLIRHLWHGSRADHLCMANGRYDARMDAIGRDRCCARLHCLVFPAEYVRGDGDSQRTSLIRGCPALWRIALHAFV